MLRPSEAQLAELCGYFPALRRRNTPTTGGAAAFGAAFAALVANLANEYELCKSRLDEKQVGEVEGLAETYAELMPRGQGALVEFQFALLPDGRRCDWDDPARITRGKIDARWWDEDGGTRVAVLRDDKTGLAAIPHPKDNLQFGVYAKALEDEIPWGTPIRGEVANPRTEQLVKHVYQRGEIEALWQRFLAADLKANVKEPVAEPGGHCADCYERQRCDVRLLPAMQGDTAPALAPFMFGGPPLTAESAVQARRVLDALAEVIDRADEHLRQFVSEAGPIRDGKKEWAATVCKGRTTADAKLLAADGLTKYLKQSAPYTRFGWRNAR